MTVGEFWKEFLNKNNNITVSCKTQNEANEFCKLMNEQGLTWRFGDSYLGNNCWHVHKENTCYDNEGCYSEYNWYKRCNYTIYEYEDIFGRDDQSSIETDEYISKEEVKALIMAQMPNSPMRSTIIHLINVMESKRC